MLENNRIKTYSGSGVYYTNDILPESTPEVMAIRKLFRQQLTEGIRSYEAPDVFDYVDLHFRQIKNGEINPKTGMAWTIDDVPKLFRAATAAWLEANTD